MMSKLEDSVTFNQDVSYSCKEKTIILNVFQYFKKLYPDKSISEIVTCTSDATGCEERSIYSFQKEEATHVKIKDLPKRKEKKNIPDNSPLKYSESVRDRIKHIIYDLQSRNIPQSVNNVFKNVRCDETLPDISLKNLKVLLFDMGFCYEREKTSNKLVLIKKNELYIKSECDTETDNLYNNKQIKVEEAETADINLQGNNNETTDLSSLQIKIEDEWTSNEVNYFESTEMVSHSRNNETGNYSSVQIKTQDIEDIKVEQD